jgi:GNAT acetyltransferase-like protein
VDTLPTAAETGAASSVFDTVAWQDAWALATVEKIAATHRYRGVPMYLVQHSPFWQGYETDAGVASVWSGAVLVVGSLYAFYGPVPECPDLGVGGVVDHARKLAAEWGARGVLVLNQPEESAREWAAARAPDAQVRLDVAYHRLLGVGPDPILGQLHKHARTDWRRRWRRAAEKGVRLVEDQAPLASQIDEVVALANGSAVRHGIAPLYDQDTVRAVLGLSGARLIRADWSGRTVAGFVAIEHDRRLYLWAGGIDYDVLAQVSVYLFLLYELLGAAGERGWRRMEFGRGNYAFKRRYGFTGVPLWSLWYEPCPGATSGHSERLAQLHDRLTDFMGL